MFRAAHGARSRDEDVGPAIVARVVGQAHRLLGRRADLPQVDLVVGDVVVVTALRGRPHQPFAVARQLRKVLVRSAARDVDQRERVDVRVALGRLAVLDRHVKHAAAAVAGGMHPVDLAGHRAPVDLAAVPGSRPGLLAHVPDPGLALGAAQRDRDDSGRPSTSRAAAGARRRDRAPSCCRRARSPLRCPELAANDRRRARVHDLVVRDPAAPAGVVDDLGLVVAVGRDRVDVPLAVGVGVALEHPALLAAGEQDAAAVGREAREPVDRVAVGDGWTSEPSVFIVNRSWLPSRELDQTIVPFALPPTSSMSCCVGSSGFSSLPWAPRRPRWRSRPPPRTRRRRRAARTSARRDSGDAHGAVLCSGWHGRRVGDVGGVAKTAREPGANAARADSRARRIACAQSRSASLMKPATAYGVSGGSFMTRAEHVGERAAEGHGQVQERASARLRAPGSGAELVAA